MLPVREVDVVFVLKVVEEVGVDDEVVVDLRSSSASSAERRAIVSNWEARNVCMGGTETSRRGVWLDGAFKA